VSATYHAAVHTRRRRLAPFVGKEVASA
jgi:hypothetical protein